MDLKSEKKPQMIDVDFLRNALSTDGKEVAQKILNSPQAVEMINRAWQQGNVKKFNWKEIQIFAESSSTKSEDKITLDEKPGGSAKQDETSKEKKRQGYYSVIFLQNPDGSFEPYVIGKEFAHGGKGFLKHAYSLATGKHVALKIVRNITTDESQEEIEREKHGLNYYKRLIADQKRPERGKAYLAQDFVRGGDLTAYLSSLSNLTSLNDIKIFHIQTILHIITNLLMEIDALHHEGYVHRDLKPGNVMLTTNTRFQGTGSTVANIVPIDFGSMDKNSGKKVSITFGTGAYLAPEINRNDNMVSFTQATDAYAVGLIIREFNEFLNKTMVKGAILRNFKSEKENFTNLLGKLAEIVQGLVDPNPQSRSTIHHALAELQSFMMKDLETSTLIAPETREGLQQKHEKQISP